MAEHNYDAPQANCLKAFGAVQLIRSFQGGWVQRACSARRVKAEECAH